MESMEKMTEVELEGNRLRVVNDHWGYVVSSSLSFLIDRVKGRRTLFYQIKERRND